MTFLDDLKALARRRKRPSKKRPSKKRPSKKRPSKKRPSKKASKKRASKKRPSKKRPSNVRYMVRKANGRWVFAKESKYRAWKGKKKRVIV